jgi:hypothetical protein
MPKTAPEIVIIFFINIQIYLMNLLYPVVIFTIGIFAPPKQPHLGGTVS